MKKRFGKRWTAVLLAAVLLLSLSIPAMAARTFTDVRGKRWSYKAVEYCYAKKYMDGTGKGKFEPSGTVQRKMVAQVLWNKSGKPAATEENPFTDVPEGKWFTEAVKWAKETGVVNGTTETAFSPDRNVSRQDVCVMVYRYYSMGLAETPEIAAESEMTRFTDYGKVSSYAKEAIRWAIKSGFMSGDSATTLSPLGTAKREELAQFLMNLDKILGVDTDNFKAPVDTEPEPTPAPSSEIAKFSKTAAGVGVSGVEFNPQAYAVRAVLANDKLFSVEGAANIAKRTNAVVAVNGAFYNSYDANDLTTYATLISNGKLLRLDNSAAPYKPTFVVDSNGKASIEFFKTYQKVTCLRDGEVLGNPYTEVGCNMKVPENVATKMIYTRTYGDKIEGKMASAAVVNEDGVITKVYRNASNVPIPEKGFVLAHRKEASQWATFLSNCKEGDQLEISTEYRGSSTQDIVTALSCGPTLVKNGKAYGNAQTYIQEGFKDAHVTVGAAARMAIGVKANGTVVIAHATCSLGQLSNAMAALGCQTAMNLDGGDSCALYLNGSAAVPAGRFMSNMLVFTKK